MRESELVAALRRREESAFTELVRRNHAMLVRLATSYISDAGLAEEVAQETWLAVLEGIDAFEERSSLKTWIVSILVNKARTRALRERRSVAFTDLQTPESGVDDPTVPAERFRATSEGQVPANWWAVPPRSWGSSPEEVLLASETRCLIAHAIEALPAPLQAVIQLRDVEGWTAADVCVALDLTDGHQRVLLHRARSRVRAALERHFRSE